MQKINLPDVFGFLILWQIANPAFKFGANSVSTSRAEEIDPFLFLEVILTF